MISEEYLRNEAVQKTYIIEHLIADFEILGCEEVFQRLLLFSVHYISERVDFDAWNSYRLILLNWCSVPPFFVVIEISNVRLADMAPPTRDITITEIVSKDMYVAGFGTNIKLLSRQNRCPSFALMLHLTPDC